MNFFGHAAIARERDSDPRFVLGAMIPDFASMARARLVVATDDALAGGIALHHQTDEVFHATPEFVALCTSGVARLEAAGVGRGGARAAAHVGVELLLDGSLLDDGDARAGYLAAIAADAGEITWHDDAGRTRFHHLHGRLRAWGMPEGYRSAQFVADRIAGALAHRPRLALDAGEARTVADWLAEVQPDVESSAPAILAAVRRRLGHAASSPARHGHGILRADP